ncbi:MAG TPA: TonB family protein [Gemmatimonadales bacterium]|jgi:TonB family protein
MRLQLTTVAFLGAMACRGSSSRSDAQTSQAAPPPESEAPVALNPDVPIAYPPALFDQKVEGDVTLQLFVDSTGKLIPESTRVADPSGYPALDSAALAGAAGLRFAPAKRHGVAVATAFLQPVEFRQVGTTRTGRVELPAPPAPATVPPPAARPRPRPTVVPSDTMRADTTRVRPAPPAPPRPPVPVPVPTPADTTRPDTTKARPDTSATAH